jgi:predicted DNA-binding antitoxin AbrB/MazE fold protein
MTYKIEAIYENGLLKPLKKLHFPEHLKVHIAIMIDEDLSSIDIAKLAQKEKGFDFLNNPEEDIYSPNDGQKV